MGRVRICFVCSGNICRSPTAEAVLDAMLRDAGRDDIEVDSAGTGDWHAGDDMDSRARRTLRAHGYDRPRHEAKQFTAADFASRDLVVALDRGHARHLIELAGRADDPQEARDKVVLLRSFDASLDPVAGGGQDLDVPDPYYDDADAFTLVLRQIEAGCSGLLASVRDDQHTPRLDPL
jgi:protein-tyrosine phosphatase